MPKRMQCGGVYGMKHNFYVNVWVTLRCNFRCRYCYEKSKYQDEDLSFESADKLVELIKNNVKAGQLLKVNFHGGEPTLNFDVIKYIVLRLENEISNEKQFGMTTNASLLNDDMIDFLCTHFTRNISISIDGKKETHEYNRKCVQGQVSYEQIFSNALKILSRVKSVRIRMTYDRKNVNQIYENVRFFIENGFKIIVPVADSFTKDWTNEDFEIVEIEFLKIKKYLAEKEITDIKFYELDNEFNQIGQCTGGNDYYNIDAYGDIYPCTFVVGDKTHKIGSLYHGIDYEKLKEIDCINNNRDKVVACKECLLFDYCKSTRCLMLNYVTTGDYYKPNLVNCNIINIKSKSCGKFM